MTRNKVMSRELAECEPSLKGRLAALEAAVDALVEESRKVEHELQRLASVQELQRRASAGA